MWYHLAVTYDGEEFVTYKDGIPIGKYILPGGLATNNEPLLIGRGPGPNHGRHFPGTIDELMIFNSALSENTIKSLFEWSAQGGGFDPISH